MAGRVGRMFLKIGFVPREIRVGPESMAELLGPLAEELGIELSAQHDLPHLDMARRSMIDFMT